MTKDKKSDKQNIGNAGEYYIAALLSANGFTATITLKNAQRYDILAVSPQSTRRSIKIQVKTLWNGSRFPLSKKNEDDGEKDFYYAFINLNGFPLSKSEPDFWIIPSQVVGPLIRDAFPKWLRESGKNHKDMTMRTLPIKLSEADKKYYPKDWDDKVKKYYKKIDPLF